MADHSESMRLQKIVESQQAEIDRLREGMHIAYGYLWHINCEPAAPIKTYSPLAASNAARRALRELMDSEERGKAINKVSELLSKQESVHE